MATWFLKKPRLILRTDRRWENLRRHPHPETRRLRTTIQDSQAKGYTTQQIVDRLNRAGISTVRGRNWNLANLYNYMQRWYLRDAPYRREYRQRRMRASAVAEVLRLIRPGPDEPFTAATLLPHICEEEWHRHAFGVKRGGDIGREIVARVEEVLLRFVDEGRLALVRHGVYRVAYRPKRR